MSSRKIITLLSFIAGTLTIGSLLSFNLGWWIPLVPTISSVFLTFLVIQQQIQIDEQQKNSLKLESLAAHPYPKFSYSTSSIQTSAEAIEELSWKVLNRLFEEHKIAQQEGLLSIDESFWEQKDSQDLQEIVQKSREIAEQINLIAKSQNRIVRLRQKLEQPETNVNELAA